MIAKNLQFFDYNGYNLNFEWMGGETDGYWEGYIYLPKVSVGLYANTTIYVLEESGDSFSFPKGPGTITFKWDILNKFVDEFFMFNFDESYMIKETSSLIYTPNDGPDCETLIVNRFDEYNVDLKSIVTTKPLPIHIAFMANEKYDATTYNRTLIMYYNNRVVARIKFYAETVEEDERLKIWNDNLGYNITPEDEMIFYKSDIKEYRPNYELLNEKRKELMLEGSNIYPYIGSYRAIINAIKFFGYENLNIIEYWRNVNPNDENFGKIYHSSKYSLTHKETLRVGARNIVLPNKDYKKINALALVYSINRPTKDIDDWELPKVRELFTYTIEEALIKLFALRKKLNKEFMPGTSRIIDIIGEANYFGIQSIRKIHDSYSIDQFIEPAFLDFDVSPTKFIHITDNTYFNRYINLEKSEDEDDESANLNNQMLSDINNVVIGDINEMVVDQSVFYTLSDLSNIEKCEYYINYYHDAFVDYVVYKDIENNDDYPYIAEGTYTDPNDPFSRFSAKVVLTNNTFKNITFEDCDLKFNCKFSTYKYENTTLDDCSEMFDVYSDKQFSPINETKTYGEFVRNEENGYEDYTRNAKTVVGIDFDSQTYDVTFENIDECGFPNRISWKIEMSQNQFDDDLKNVGITKEYKYYDLYTFNEHFNTDKVCIENADIKQYNKFFAELPFVGYYDVTMTIGYDDGHNGMTNIRKITKKKCIKVEPYQIDMIGFYYDARNLPEKLQYEEDIQMNEFVQENITNMYNWAVTERTAPDIDMDMSVPIMSASSFETDSSNHLIYKSGEVSNYTLEEYREFYEEQHSEDFDWNVFIDHCRETFRTINGQNITPGPYMTGNVEDEWYLADNLTYEMAKLQPLLKYTRYIKSGVDVKPYTWFLLGYEFSKISGKVNPRWTVTNISTGTKKTWEGRYLTLLLKKEGNYTVTLKLEDKNGNTYEISRNIIVVNKSANYKIYQTFKKEYDYITEQTMLKELNDYKIYYADDGE